MRAAAVLKHESKNRNKNESEIIKDKGQWEARGREGVRPSEGRPRHPGPAVASNCRCDGGRGIPPAPRPRSS